MNVFVSSMREKAPFYSEKAGCSLAKAGFLAHLSYMRGFTVARLRRNCTGLALFLCLFIVVNERHYLCQDLIVRFLLFVRERQPKYMLFFWEIATLSSFKQRARRVLPHLILRESIPDVDNEESLSVYLTK